MTPVSAAGSGLADAPDAEVFAEIRRRKDRFYPNDRRIAQLDQVGVAEGEVDPHLGLGRGSRVRLGRFAA